MKKELNSIEKETFESFVVSFIKGKIRYKRTGKEYICPCPFCGGGGRNDSFHINLDKGVAHCWRANNCNWSGNHFKLVKDLTQDDEYARDLFNADKENTYRFIKANLNLYQKALARNTKLKPLEDLNVFVEGAQRIRYFDLYKKCSRVWDWLHQRGYNPEKFLEHHSIWWPPQVNEMRDRVVFEVLSDGNRAYLAYTMNLNEKKYKTLNPPNQVLSRLLYNYDNIKEGAKCIFICEGIFDAARLIDYGLDAVCIFGSNISSYQINLLLKKKPQEICVFLDSDATNSALKIVQELNRWTAHLDLSVIFIEEAGKDPDDLSFQEVSKLFKKRALRMKEK